MKATAFITAIMAAATLTGLADTSITNLRVAGCDAPLAVEDKDPTFSWQMVSDTPGQKQTAYQITVATADGAQMWDSGKVTSGISNNIRYGGSTLDRETAYCVNLTVWDANGSSLTASTTFETGLMDFNAGSEAQWAGAQWIGNKQRSFDARQLFYYTLEYTFKIKSGSTSSIIIAANDFRFKDDFQNAEHMAGENWYRLEFDLSDAGGTDGAAFRVYRLGYNASDPGNTTPILNICKADFSSTNINALFTADNKNVEHAITLTYIQDASYDMTITVDGHYLSAWESGVDAAATGFNITANENNEYATSFMHLNSIGFAANPGDEVEYTDYVIRTRGASVDDQVFNADYYDVFAPIDFVTVDGSTIKVKNTGSDFRMGYVDPSHGSMTMLRTVVDTGAKEIAKAKMYVTAMGGYEIHINGQRMGDDWFAPGSSQIREVMGYNAYDVTSLMKTGKNVIGATLLPCWWTGHLTKDIYNYNFFGDHEALMAKLVITYTDGTSETKVTNTTDWLSYKDGPLRSGSFVDGEFYDARREPYVAGWNSDASFDASAWIAPAVIDRRDWEEFYLMGRYDRTIQVCDTITATELMPAHSSDGRTYIYNMGTNLTGAPRISIPKGWLAANDTVIIRLSEQVYPGGRGDLEVYENTYGVNGMGLTGRQLRDNYRNAMATIFYVAKGAEEVVISPISLYCGYQYIQITIPNHSGSLPLSNVQALVLSSDALPTGTYHAETSDGTTGELVNQLFSNIQRSQLGNFQTIPTDCPQRDERMGWTGDAQVYCRTASYNSDVYNFFRQWMVSVRADQQIASDWCPAGGIGFTVPTYMTTKEANFCDATTWSAAVCMVPWQMYAQYGDFRIVEENYDAMKAWLEGMACFAYKNKWPKEYFDGTYPEKDYQYLAWWTTGFADWLELTPRSSEVETMTNLDETARVSEVLNNAIYIYMMELMADMAAAKGDTEYAATLRDRHDAAKEEWNEAFVDPTTHKTRFMTGKILHSQSSYASPLVHNVFNDENRPYAIQYLAELTAHPSQSGNGGYSFNDYTITTGFNGTPNMLPALSHNGRVADAYSLFTSTAYPSWLYPVTNGATSIWERWNGYESAFGQGDGNNMNSFNHFALGSVGQWMYEYQLGITGGVTEDGTRGYKHFTLQPQAGGTFTSLSGSYESNYGTIRSSWTADGHGVMRFYTCTVPANTTATLYLPVSDDVATASDSSYATFDSFCTWNGLRCAKYTLASGSHTFTISTNAISVN